MQMCATPGQVSMEARRGFESPGAGAIDGCELPIVSAGYQLRFCGRSGSALTSEPSL